MNIYDNRQCNQKIHGTPVPGANNVHKEINNFVCKLYNNCNCQKPVS